MENKRVKLQDLTINDSNPRTISVDKLEKLVVSLLVFPKMLGLREIVYIPGGKIIGGNMRFRALSAIADLSQEEIREKIETSRKGQKLSPREREILIKGWAKFAEDPKIVAKEAVDLTEDEIREFIIKDNESYGEWDWVDLGNNWDEEELISFDLDVWQPEEPEEKGSGAGAGVGSAEAFEVVVSCDNPAEQTRLLNELKGRGYKCKSNSL